MPIETEKKKPYEPPNPHVHRFTSYLADLKNNWAYVGTSREPRFKSVR